MQSAIPSQLSLNHRTGSLQETLAGKTLLIIGSTAFVAWCAHISVPLPFTPVPLTLQNFAVVLVGLVLGPVAGFSAMVLYLVEGAFAPPASSPPAPSTCGWLLSAVPPLPSRFRSAVVAATPAKLPIFLLGASWFSYYAH